MTIEVVSDGMPGETRVRCAETGEVLSGVKEVRWLVNGTDSEEGLLVLVLNGFKIHAQGKMPTGPPDTWRSFVKKEPLDPELRGKASPVA